MAIRSQRIVSAFVGRGATRRPAANQNRTLCITLAARAGATPSRRPPVRIFLGTESAQFRAERAFVWSIERARDPGRTYEIHLMKDLAGFERRLWLTGFTNYRFAIPDLAGRRGRAIYNDADQIYLRDPAELFDLDMGEAGVLSINDRDTSVMLIDCAKMAPLWNDESARNTRNRDLEAKMRDAGLWGDLDDGWNARDAEYDPATSHLIHYTTIHTQPWRPQPRDYVYRGNPARDIWMQVEAEADRAGFQLFGPKAPSPGFENLAIRELEAGGGRARLADVRRAIQDTRAGEVIYYGTDSAAALRGAANAANVATGRLEVNALTAIGDTTSRASADLVAAGGLEQLPDLDMPWVLDRLFARARRAVIVTLALDERASRRSPADALWWHQQLAAAGTRFPDRHWRLVVRRKNRLLPDSVRRWTGGVFLSRRPQTWALCHYKTGHRSQALGVADALGWPYEIKNVEKNTAGYLARMLGYRLGLGRAALSAELSSPWPDVVIASGWLPAVLARWISARNHRLTRLVLLGRRGGRTGETQDVAVVCRHFQLPPHPRQLETLLPPSRAATSKLAEAAARWPDLCPRDSSGPNVAFLVGGDSVLHALDAGTAADVGRRVQGAVDARDGRLAVLTSRRTPRSASKALNAALTGPSRFIAWRRFKPGTDNPYLGYLAHADVLIVTGESESMLAEAIATGKPVYIVDLPARSPGPRRRIADWVVKQAATDRFNARGSRRPQQGLQYVCARLVDRRVFVPRRDMAGLHAALIEHGLARRFEGGLESWAPPVWQETECLAQRIRALLPTAAGEPDDAEPALADAAHGC